MAAVLLILLLQPHACKYDMQTLVWTLVGSLCSSSASLVCCPGLDHLGSHHLPHPRSQKECTSGKKASNDMHCVLKYYSYIQIIDSDLKAKLIKIFISLPLSCLLSGVCWCMGGVCRNAFAQSMVGSAVCRDRWVYAAVAASHPQGRFLPLLSSPVSLRHSDSSPGSREGGPSCVGTACIGSCQPHTCYPAQERHLGR